MGITEDKGRKKKDQRNRETGPEEEMWTKQAGREQSDGGRMKGEK